MDKKLINRSFERCINSGMKANQIAPKYISKVEFKKRVKKIGI